MTNPVKVGLVFGFFVALAHVGWATLVATGHAQRLVDFIFWAHFISPPFHVEAFDMMRAGILVGVTFAVAFIGGVVASLIWNIFHR
jgi:hypothetical protein